MRLKREQFENKSKASVDSSTGKKKVDSSVDMSVDSPQKTLFFLFFCVLQKKGHHIGLER